MAHNITDAKLRQRALDHDCPTCRRKAGKRCAMLYPDGTPTQSRGIRKYPHEERVSLTWRAVLAGRR
jgi:hypothetical protein